MQLDSRPLDRLVAHAPSGIGLWDRDLRCLLVNDAFAQVTGVPVEQHRGRALASLLPVTPSTVTALHAALSGRESIDVELSVDSASWLASFFPVRSTRGGVIGLGTVVREVTALAHRATHDPLTGLPDRRLFSDRIAGAACRAQRSGRVAGVFFIDLDDFKQVNDELGHAAGDALLVEVASRVRAALRPGDSVGRLGGDEFGVLCEDLDDQRDGLVVAQRVLACLVRPAEIKGRVVSASASVGVAFTTGGTFDGDELLRQADAAMYRAKQDGGGRCEIFDRAMRTRLRRRFTFEQELRGAAERGELRLHFQPQVSLVRDARVGVEALVRWQHPQRGLLGPGQFIADAEATGAIQAIGAWVLDEACRAAGQLAPLRISVNLSPAQLDRPDLVDSVAAALERHGLEPGRLGLEVTETQFMQDTRANAITFAALRALGVRIVLDDFGAGYSSLAYLRRLPLDEIKLDRLFVRRLHASDGGLDERIAAFVVGLGQALELDTVAEGVETDAQAAALRRLGFDVVQGYLHGRPAPLEEAPA